MGDDAYAKRQRRKKAGGQGCMITLLALAGIAATIGEAVRVLVS